MHRTRRADGRYSVTARVDPQTHFLQDWQPNGDRRAQRPYARHEVITPADLSSAAQRAALIEPLVQFQLSAQASTLVAPYAHIDQPDSGWIDVQAQLWRSTRQVLDRHGVAVPVLGVLAVGWRCLSPVSGLAMLEPLWAARAEPGPADVAIATSRVHLGGETDERLVDLLLLVEGLSRRHRVIAWQQGLFGEACVAAGASGYETGIGWRESCDMQRAMTTRRSLPASDAHPGVRPVYLPELARSVPKSTIKAINSNDQSLWQGLVCPDVSCCAPGGADLMRDAVATPRSRDRLLSKRSSCRPTGMGVGNPRREGETRTGPRQQDQPDCVTASRSVRPGGHRRGCHCSTSALEPVRNRHHTQPSTRLAARLCVAADPRWLLAAGAARNLASRIVKVTFRMSRE
jgi:hypothetical protein